VEDEVGEEVKGGGDVFVEDLDVEADGLLAGKGVEMPLTSGASSREPESIQTPMATERRWLMRSVRTSRPLGRVVVRMSRVWARVVDAFSATGTETGIKPIVS
jgi:hypothetical protein